MSTSKVELAVPNGVQTEILPGVWVKHVLGVSVHMTIEVHGYQAPPPEVFMSGSQPRDAYIPRSTPATDPADVPSMIPFTYPFRSDYDQRCAALPVGQHVDHCSCTGSASSLELT